MRSNSMWVVIIVLVIAVAALSWFLFAAPGTTNTVVTGTPTTTNTGTGTGAGTGTGTGTGTATAGTSNPPLSSRVVVTSPKANSKVAKTFTVAGQAPGNWYSEAVFPIQVRDANNNVVGSGQAHAQGDWMTTAQVTFTANVTVTNYSGPATLVLMRDNPSGLPENDDSVSIPITVQ